MKWTDEQARVIESRGRNLLVSAAAGSGKTAVMIARIMALITDPVSPADIDRLLVVTFTNAAASEMKERLTKAIEDALAQDPGDAHLRRQLLLVHNAQITTIDGFSAFVLREYGSRIGLAGNFRIAAEGEAELLQTEVLEQVLTESHEEGSAEFYDFVETFAPGKSEKFLSTLILSIFKAAMATPDPEAWIRSLAEDLPREHPEQFLFSPFFIDHMDEAAALAREGLRLAQENLAIAQSPAGPAAYIPCAQSDLAFFTELCGKCSDYTEARTLLRAFSPVRLSGARAKATEDASLRPRFKANRDAHKALRETLSEEYFPYPLGDVLRFEQLSAPPLLTLLSLTGRFMEAFSAAKRDRGIVDFADLEQLSLRILRDPDGRCTDAAAELRARFCHVMIDEYQDSNMLQEALLTAVSRIPEGGANYFNVGDVKQSIYSFRQARPSLFISKYETYPTSPREDAKEERIDLHANFRSRPEVTRSVNLIFSQIMRKEIGGITYDQAAALVPGADYPEDPSPEASDYTTECLLVYTKEEEVPGLSGRDAQMALEARAVGQRIRELVSSFRIYDKKTKVYRTASYRDIVILARTGGRVADILTRVLTGMDIPVYRNSKTGYFTAKEVRLVLDYLRILDNPRQDIPLAAVLHSPFGELTSDGLAKIRIETAQSGQPFADFYDRARYYAENGNDPSVRASLSAFFDLYDDLRARAADTPAYELLSLLYDRSGFASIMAAGPGGIQRAANLQTLIDKAYTYEQTSFSGLFHFIRYIDELGKSGIDFGESSTIGEEEDTVRIMTIHRSKGLEFPIVFVAGLDGHFNRTDLSGAVLLHPTAGIASDYIDYNARTKAKTLKKQALKRKLLDDSLGEELRVLYVAMTRAEQKLILSTLINDRKMLDGMKPVLSSDEVLLPAGLIRKAQTYRAVVLPALARQEEKCVCECEMIGKPAGGNGEIVRLIEVLPSSLTTAETISAAKSGLLYRKLLQTDRSRTYDAASEALYEERFSYRYPYAETSGVPEKISVSELKAARRRDDDAVPVYEEPPVVPYIPAFAREEKDSFAPGSVRGSAFHRFLELIDYSSLPEMPDPEDLAAQCERICAQGLMTPEEASLLRFDLLAGFCRSSLAQRMRAADASGKLFREQPFTIKMRASDADPAWPSTEEILVQGIIDAYFEEDGKLVLIDYKTDRAAKENGAAVLKDRYAVQLLAYAHALRTLRALPVSEIYIYSFALGEAIPLM